jgi:hypothetical protein
VKRGSYKAEVGAKLFEIVGAGAGAETNSFGSTTPLFVLCKAMTGVWHFQIIGNVLK